LIETAKQRPTIDITSFEHFNPNDPDTSTEYFDVVNRFFGFCQSFGTSNNGNWWPHFPSPDQHQLAKIRQRWLKQKSSNRINDELDVRAITGSASQSSVLFQAGISTADLCLAVTGSDEVNIVAASMARAMGARRSIARVYSPVFRDLSTFDYQRHFKIDRMMSLEHLSALELARGIRGSGSIVVEQVARGELEVQEFIVGQEGKLTSSPVRELGLPANVRIGTIQREQRMWIASADDTMQIGDKVTVFARPGDMAPIKTLFKMGDSTVRRVVIAGGGETGLHLARMLERETFKVTIIEQDETRSNILANLLERATVIRGDAKGREFLEELRVGTADVFVAATGEDECPCWAVWALARRLVNVM